MTSDPTGIQTVLSSALTQVVTAVISYIPHLISAFFVILLGSLIANWVRWIVIKILVTIRFNKIINNSPLDKFLERAELNLKIEVIIGNIFKWLVWLIFFIAAVNILGLTTVSIFLTNILGYIPNVIASILILTLGTLIAGLIESLVKSSFSQISRSTGRMVSKLGSYVIMAFTVLAAIAQLGIAPELINTLFVGFVAMLAIGLGLAFGLGSKDLVAKILDDWYERLKKDLK